MSNFAFLTQKLLSKRQLFQNTAKLLLTKMNIFRQDFLIRNNEFEKWSINISFSARDREKYPTLMEILNKIILQTSFPLRNEIISILEYFFPDALFFS